MKPLSALVCALALALPMTAPVKAQDVPYKPEAVMSLAEKVADYQLATMAGGEIPPKASGDTPHLKGWVQGALFVGLTALADHSDKPHYKKVIMSRGIANKWRLGDRIFHADDHVIGQSYLWAARNGAGEAALKPTQATLDRILITQPKGDLVHTEYGTGRDCSDRWCWCDALFMAPPVWFEMSKVTGNPAYADYAKQEFRAATDYLYDTEEHLYFRDSRFFDRREANGAKQFWSRGNGWVLAGLARTIPLLAEDDPERAYYIGIFREMAAKLKTIQTAEGYWAPSLLSDRDKALPESSGTGFFVYGLAWGVNAGILDRKEYEPTIRKGWAALTRAVHPDGKLGWVQPVSDRPESVEYDDTQFYGVGAFLLAATEVSEMKLGK
ncbi:glycoside hydrolase family 88/105 protein [Asticcacaulis tiandongensis]|uniref:glycoside hydrolase family 88/105 protein n=1 Tax=Asticcacaulis tiandongensis TaxID=2565365 RepID=UPI001126C446|nr:glycoside hydrolase family 88 protein [Asticcacaulis tiandongensis]